MRSRLASMNSSVLRRTIVTKTRNVVNSENSQSSQQDKVVEEHFISTVSHQPPRRPLVQQFTHQVTNQVPPLERIDLYESDLALREFVTDDKCGQIKEMGAELGTYHWFEQGHRANRQVPTLHQFDRYGQRIDEVHFHPAYHELMRIGMKYGVHSVAWESLSAGDDKKANSHGHLQHAAALYILGHIEAGVCCPLSMTYAGYPVLHRYLSKTGPELTNSFPLDKVLSRRYDRRFLPATFKSGLTIGMAMTEKQGGSDVRANTTKAYCDNADEKRYILIGHKWFCSAPMCDGFLVLAQIHNDDTSNKSLNNTPSCFFVPRWLPNGERNPFYIQRLKDKLGNRSNASSEVEFNNTQGWLLGNEHEGVKTIIEMVHGTRLDSAVGSAALIRQGLIQATWHARHRKAFGRLLIDQSLMKQVLSDLLLESEAATTLVMYVASLFDSISHTSEMKSFARIATAIAKFWVCKRTPEATVEALECLGGAGFVEESNMPRVYREAPLNSIWEGSGNVMCLDILRAMKKSPESLQAYMSFMKDTKGANKHLDATLAHIQKSLLTNDLSNEILERHARTLTSQLALCLQASLLIRRFPQAVSDAFCASRLGPDRGSIFGDLPMGIDANVLAKRLPFA
ncbi:unnamed protein product [Adineta ricciae]|uniref:DNA alkylation response protein n=1 Tax=Adineta ricciae TaxID=249248 RepID=A0A814BWI5_ADIRI|nr:unnamed protein product [Adineta ricciae]CAF1460525.1 unnamed protein product [Adineta ricciae]